MKPIKFTNDFPKNNSFHKKKTCLLISNSLEYLLLYIFIFEVINNPTKSFIYLESPWYL